MKEEDLEQIAIDGTKKMIPITAIQSYGNDRAFFAFGVDGHLYYRCGSQNKNYIILTRNFDLAIEQAKEMGVYHNDDNININQ